MQQTLILKANHLKIMQTPAETIAANITLAAKQKLTSNQSLCHRSSKLFHTASIVTVQQDWG